MYKRKNIALSAGISPLSSFLVGLVSSLVLAQASFGVELDYVWSIGASVSDICTDEFGSTYLTGYTAGNLVDINPGPGIEFVYPNDPVTSADLKAYVVKLDPSGEIDWVAQARGAFPNVDVLAIDQSGNLCVAGNMTGYPSPPIDFDPDGGGFELSAYGNVPGFLWKVDSNGQFLWAKAFGGPDSVGLRIFDVAFDSSGNVYATGTFGRPTDFNPGPAEYWLTTDCETGDCGWATFVVKLNANGRFQWAGSFVGHDSEAFELAVSDSQEVYVTGRFSLTVDFDPAVGSTNFATTEPLTDEVFIVKLSRSGALAWLRTIKAGTRHTNQPHGLALDSAGNICIFGLFIGVVDFDPGPGTAYLGPSPILRNGFILKLSSTGSFIWAKELVGAIVYGSGKGEIFIDRFDRINIVGGFSMYMDFDPGPGTVLFTTDPQYEAFVLILNTDGEYIWAGQFGGGLWTEGDEISVDPAGNIYILGGFTNEGDFDPGSGQVILSTADPENYATDGFVLKLTTENDSLWVDFGYSGPESGTNDRPYSTLGSALPLLRPDMTVRIKGDSSVTSTSETITISTPSWIEAVGGAVQIGTPRSRRLEDAASSGL